MHVGNGRESSGVQSGVAPQSSIIAVKLRKCESESFTRTTDIMRAIKYVSDKAQNLAMPVAMNLSFGTNHGAHNGESVFETYIDEISRRWKTAIVVATRK